MKKNVLVSLVVTMVLGASSLFGASCEDKFTMDYTFFGAPDKSYVVIKNTFAKMTPSFPSGKLNGATVEIDLTSTDTSADMNNGKTQWPAAMESVRNNNIVRQFFGNFDTDKTKGTAKIVAVNADSVDVEITLNGKTQKINMDTKVDGDMLKASGKLDVAKFAPSAWKKFSAICKGFHKGKSWETIDLFFEVPSSCK
jgi:hypothetical protein